MERFDWIAPIRLDTIKLKIFGLWPAGDGTYQKNFYTVWAIFWLLVFNLGPNIFQTTNMFFILDDLEAVVGNIFVMFSEWLSMIKTYYVLRNIKILKQLIVTIQRDLFQPKNLQQIELIQPSLRFWKMNYTLYWSVTTGAVFFLCFYPILDRNGEARRLPFMAWYPFDTTKSPIYEITYAYQFIGLVCSAATALCVDCLITVLYFYISAQIELLCDNIRNLDSASKQFNSKLIESINHHKEILKFAQNTNQFANWIIFMQFFISAVSIGMTMFQLTKVTPLTSEFFSLLSFLSSMATQIFMYCWYGNEVTVNSEKLPYAIFESNWFEESQITKKNLIFFAVRCFKPIRMSALNLFYLSLDTFVSILRTAYSYFALLSHVSS